MLKKILLISIAVTMPLYAQNATNNAVAPAAANANTSANAAAGPAVVIQDQNLSEIEVFAKKQHEEDEAFRKKIHASHIPIQQKLDAIKQHREQQKQEHDAFLKKMRLERMPHHGMPNANAADNNR